MSIEWIDGMVFQALHRAVLLIVLQVVTHWQDWVKFKLNGTFLLAC